MRTLSFIAMLLVSIPLFAEVIDIKLVGTKNYPPFAYLEDGEFRGLLVDIVRAVDDNLPQYKIQLEAEAMTNIRERLGKGDASGFLGSYFAINEWPEVYPYSYPIFHEQMAVICNARFSKGAQLTWPQDFKGVKLGVIRNYTGWRKYGAKARDLGTFNVIELPSPEVALQAVQNEALECVLFEETVFNEVSKQLILKKELPSHHHLEVASDITRLSVHIAYSANNIVGKDDKSSFIKEFDRVFFKMLSDNQLDEIYQRYGVGY